LKATASHHVAFENATVPENNVLNLATARSCMPGALYGAPMQLLTLLHGTLKLGMAEGALDDLVAMARGGGRRQRAATAMRDSDIFQYELGRIQAKFGAAQMVHDTLVAKFWQQAQAGTLNTPDRFTEATQFAIWITETCVEVVQSCFTLAGGSAVYDSSPLQRRLRDIETAAQHAGTHRHQYALAGKLLLSKGD
jgi:alkylation response protein AidB-like acyl-CoA dehydrogenase